MFQSNPLSGLSVLALALLPAVFAPSAVRANSQLTPSINVSEGYDNNVFNGPRDEESAFVTYLIPTLKFQETGDQGQTLLELGGTQRLYTRFSDLNSFDTFLRWGLQRKLTQRLSLITNGRLDNYQRLDSASQSNVVLQSGRPDLQTYNGDVRAQYQLTELFALNLSGGVSGEAYGRSPGINASYQDSDTQWIQLGSQRALSKLDVVGLNGQYNHTFSDKSRTASEVDTTIASLTSFWQRTWSPLWSTSLSLGGRRLETDFSGGGSADFGFVGGASLSRTLKRGSASLSYNRESRGASGGNSSLDIDTLSATLMHHLSQRVSLTLTGTYQRLASAGETQILSICSGPFGPFLCLVTTKSETDDQLLRGLVSLDWHARKRLHTFLRLTTADTSSTGDRPSTEYNKMLAEIGFRYFYDLDL